MGRRSNEKLQYEESHKNIDEGQAMGIVWKLILQIILDRTSAIVNAWNKLDKRPDCCPAKVFHCSGCQTFVAAVGSDGRCGRCNPTGKF